jgi:hypothetical protein
MKKTLVSKGKKPGFEIHFAMYSPLHVDLSDSKFESFWKTFSELNKKIKEWCESDVCITSKIDDILRGSVASLNISSISTAENSLTVHILGQEVVFERHTQENEKLLTFNGYNVIRIDYFDELGNCFDVNMSGSDSSNLGPGPVVF